MMIKKISSKNVKLKAAKSTAKNNTTELVFILDRSGSMAGLEQDTIGGFNSMIGKQKKEDGECYVTTVLFDHEIITLHDRVSLDKIEPMIAMKDWPIYLDDNGWTAITRDHGWCSHYEHTVAVTTGDPEILTWPGARV